jgi:plasmid maintenance system antidote protein VapI
MALRLSRLFGDSAEFRLKAQHAGALWDFEQRYREQLSQIKPLNAT